MTQPSPNTRGPSPRRASRRGVLFWRTYKPAMTSETAPNRRLVASERRIASHWAVGRLMLTPASLARISHQAACAMSPSPWFSNALCQFRTFLRACTLRWPRPRRSFRPVRARAPSTIGTAMLSVASTRRGRKSSAIIAAPGEKCGLGECQPPPELLPRDSKARQPCGG